MGTDGVLVQNLTKSYGRNRVVDGVTFSVEAGDVFGLLGPNGAGKSTIIRCLLGLTSGDAGQVTVLGETLPTGFSRIANRVGVVFEDANLYPRLTGWQNLHFFARLYGVTADEIRPLTARYGLTEVLHRPVNTYSKGMRQRLLICRALLPSPDLLILDEPTSGLDLVSAEVIRTMIADFSTLGRLVILSSHTMVEVEALCSHVVVLHQGKIIASDSPGHLIQAVSKGTVRCRVELNDSVSESDMAAVFAGFSWELAGRTVSVVLPLDAETVGAVMARVVSLGRLLSMETVDGSLAAAFQQLINDS